MNLMYRQILLLVTLIVLNYRCTPTQNKPIIAEEIEWKSFNREVFKTAKEEKKLVFLEVGANWCHWCHVMDDSTYANDDVKKYLNENFILCREDQDARPDLFSAYKPWGWPALIVFNSDGKELLKMKGFQPPKRFLDALKKTVQNPVPLTTEENSSIKSTTVSGSTMALNSEFESKLDFKLGGYPSNNRALELNGITHAIQYQSDENKLEEWARLTIKQSYLLVDPVWSGVYQYSAKNSWNNQHYEKLLRYQADYIEAYCRYGVFMHDTESIQKAEEIIGYCKRFLKGKSQLFWNSQNADLIAGQHSGEYYKLNETDRLKQGIPSVDEKIYLKENASMINALVWLWAATGNDTYLKEGTEMLDYALTSFATQKGIYSREKGSTEIYSFEDNRRLIESLMLYAQITNSKTYLIEAENLGRRCIEVFDSKAGIKSVIGEIALASPVVLRDNLNAVMTYNKLAYLTGKNGFKTFAQKTFDLLDQEKLKASLSTLPSLIRARNELEKEPYHAKFIGGFEDDELKKSYLKAILMDKNPYFIFEELMPGEMKPEDEKFYIDFDAGTLFMCTSSYCSAPISSLQELQNFLAEQ